ncbi:thiamine metabolism- protein [Pestalotiopsis sp. IQ-011]
MEPVEAAGIATTAFSTVFVVLRVFTKLRVANERLGPADLTSIFFALALTLARLSILVFYLRLSPIRSFRWTVLGIITFLCLETLISVTLSLLIFDPAVKGRMKAADQALGMFYGVSNILVDFAILILPIGVVVPLQMSPRRKMAVLCLFGAGSLVCAISTYRVTILTFISSRTTSSNPISNQLILSFAETNGAIVCGCVPVATRFFTQFLPATPLFRRLRSLLRRRPGSRDDDDNNNTLSLSSNKSGAAALGGAGGGTYSTTIEKNRRRRREKQRGGKKLRDRLLHSLSRRGGGGDSGFAAGGSAERSDLAGSREGILLNDREMSHMGDGEGGKQQQSSQQHGYLFGNTANESFDTLERNVLGKGRADTHICAETEVFAPDREVGITCIHDTRISYGP